jgi:hypothetical protein
MFQTVDVVNPRKYGGLNAHHANLKNGAAGISGLEPLQLLHYWPMYAVFRFRPPFLNCLPVGISPRLYGLSWRADMMLSTGIKIFQID